VLIIEQSESRLVMAGVPGSRRWMIVATLIGVLLTVAVGWFGLEAYRREGVSFSLLSLGIGMLVAQFIFWTGAVTLAVGRLRLVLDRTAGTGEYQVRSPIIDAGKSCSFDLTDVHAVTIEAVREKRPHYDVVVFHARLMLNNPRRAIVLEESQNEQVERVEVVAEAVAGFLGTTAERVPETAASADV
jgi:hypothetical protein